MGHYLFTGRYSHEAFKAMVAHPSDREAAGRAVIESAGGKLVHLFFAFGVDDIFVLIEAPDDAVMASCAMALAASGAFSGGATTKLMSAAEAQAAMKKAGAILEGYKSPMKA